MNAPIHEDRRVATVIESSVIFAALARVVDGLWRAAARSTALAVARQAGQSWQQLSTPNQRLLSGLTVLVGAVTHVALMLPTATPPGWLWLIVPGLGAAAGVLLIAMAGATPRHER